MITPEIISFVKEQQAAGVLPHNIKISLQSNGWQEADILEAFRQVGIPYSGTSAVPQPAITAVAPVAVKRPIELTIIAVLAFIAALPTTAYLPIMTFGTLAFGAVSDGWIVGLIATIVLIGPIFVIVGSLYTTAFGLWKGQFYGRFSAALVLFFLACASQLRYGSLKLNPYYVETMVAPYQIGTLVVTLLILYWLYKSKRINNFLAAKSKKAALGKNPNTAIIVFSTLNLLFFILMLFPQYIIPQTTSLFVKFFELFVR